MARKKINIRVTNCDDCPFLWQNMEHPQSTCTAAKRSWGMGYHEDGDPIPEWCPLLTKVITVVMD